MAKHMDVIDQKVNTVADSPPQPLDSTHSQKIADLETQVDTLDLELALTLPTEKPATKKNEEDTDMREKKEGSQPRRDKDDKAKKHVKEPRSLRKILMLMDSNRRFLDQSLLWENLTLLQVGNISDLHVMLG